MNDDGLPPVRYSTRSTGPCECSATARPPSHSPTNRQTYKPDEGVALTNEQRVASIHHDERVRLTGRGNHMNQACVHNDTIDAGNHHGRPQYQPFLRFLTTQERNVIWLLLAIAFLPVDGTTLGLYAPFWSPISPALFRVLPMQLASTAHRSQPIPANVPPTGGLHNPVHPGMAEIRHPSQRRVHEHHRIIGRARHFGCDRHCVRHQTHSMAYAIADSHRFLLVLLRRGRGAMAIHPSAYQAVDRLFRAPHVPAVHQ